MPAWLMEMGMIPACCMPKWPEWAQVAPSDPKGPQVTPKGYPSGPKGPMGAQESPLGLGLDPFVMDPFRIP